MHDMVFDWPTVPMYQPVLDCRVVNFKELHVSRHAGGRQRPCGAEITFVTTNVTSLT